MLDGPSVVAALKRAGVTHIVWLPDSELGTWEAAITGPDGLPLIRVCREGEAFAVAAGLHLGGKHPVIVIQCTGLFEAGDALRNVVHDLRLPIFLIVGVRNYHSHQKGQTKDSCPVYTEPIFQAWQIPYTVFDVHHSADDLAREYQTARGQKKAFAVLVAE